MKPPELWSLLVFIAGVTIGTVGTILAIVFGLKSAKTQQCVCNGPNVEMFSVRTAIQPSFMAWDERFSNTSSSQYQVAVRNISQTLTAALMANNATQISSYAAFSEKTMASIQVAQLSEGKNNTIVSFAYGVVYGDESPDSLPSYADIQSKLDSDTKVVSSVTVDSVFSPSTDPCAYHLPASTIRPKTTSRAGTTPKNLLPSSSTSMSQLASHSTIRPTASPTTNMNSLSTRGSPTVTSPAVTVMRNATSTTPSKGTPSSPLSSSVPSTGHSTLANTTATPSTVIPARNFTSSTYPPLTTGRRTSTTTHSPLTTQVVTATTAVPTQPTSKPHTTKSSRSSSISPSVTSTGTATTLPQTVTSTTTTVAQPRSSSALPTAYSTRGNATGTSSTDSPAQSSISPANVYSSTTNLQSATPSITSKPRTANFSAASTATSTARTPTKTSPSPRSSTTLPLTPSTVTSTPTRSTNVPTDTTSSHTSTLSSTATPSTSSVTSITPTMSSSLMTSTSSPTTATTITSSIISPTQSSTSPANPSSPTTSLRSTTPSTTSKPRTATSATSTATSTASTPTKTSPSPPSSTTLPPTPSTVTSTPTRSTNVPTGTTSSHTSTLSSTATPSTSSATSTTPTMSTSLMTSTSSPTTATITSSALPPTTVPCAGGRKYMGDIAVAFELTTNTNSAEVESFVNTLLTYNNNPYSFSSIDNSQEAPSAYILVPYPNTDYYNPQTYGRLRESDLNASLSTFNVLLSFQPQTNAKIDEAFNFIHSVKQRSSVRNVVLVGVSDAFVQTAQQSAKQLAEDGYNIFTVSLGVADFSSLATNNSFVHVLMSPSSSVEATVIASEIGTTLVQESSVCLHTPQSTTTTATPAARSTTGQLYSTTSACKTPLIQQDIAFVVEISTSTGNLDASHAASNFITQFLIQQPFFDDLYSNFAIVPFPNASSYTVGGGVQDFGNLLKADFPLVFQMIYSVYPITNGAVSDIESGLRYAMEFEFPRLHDAYPRTIVLFANSADGVPAALDVASELKAKDVTILTVGMSDSDDFSLQPLGSAPGYNWNLPISDTSSYSLMAEVISRKLLNLGSVCVDKQ